MKETSVGQEVLQVIVIILLSIIIWSIGAYGYHMMNNEQTEAGWQIWGAFLFMLIIVLPTAGFWSKQLRKLFNLDN
jgi:hypothetical protein